MENLSFSDHVAALKYMDEDDVTRLDKDSTRAAWKEGPVIGAARVAFVSAHKAHAAALEGGDMEAIDSAWEAYCIAQNAFLEAFYR